MDEFLGLTPDDYEKVIACLKLMSSDMDGEVLAAVRAVNRIFDRTRTSWPVVLKDMARQALEDARRDLVKQEVTIDQALAHVLRTAGRGSFRDMISDYQRQWDAKHFLTDAQSAVLFKAYHRSSGSLYARR